MLVCASVCLSLKLRINIWLLKIDIVKSTREGKKYNAITHKDNGKTKTVSFGAAGMSDYTKHNDNERKSNYLSGHKANENWNDHETAAFYATRLL